ncbi:MAG: 4-hydroxy-tetrahydrodipicolinate reductase [Bacteroidales bacterium]|nr:4-hydroxy-tetrahydrodipicolinate reductase [Bacteroidales bacterium]
MRILIIGYGKMGHAVEMTALQRGHTIAGIIDVNDSFDNVNANDVDAAIEFTDPQAALGNFDKCFSRRIPLVSGTTGWYSSLQEVKQRVESGKLSFLYSSNFSVGVYLFRKLNIELAKMMEKYPAYKPSITEVHHIHKKDAPSGTAITLAEELLSHYSLMSSWAKDIQGNTDIMPVNSVRKGEEFGTHTVSYDSNEDVIEIRHTAKSRNALALGAVLGAEFIHGRQGFFTMDDMVEAINSEK